MHSNNPLFFRSLNDMRLSKFNTGNKHKTTPCSGKAGIRHKKSHGMTFIEILVALFILTTGLLGAVALQATSMKGSFDSMQRSLATGLAQDIVEKMRSNQKTIATLESYEGVYGEVLNAEPAPLCDMPGALCTPAQIVANDLYQWEFNIMGLGVTKSVGSSGIGGLVEGRGCIQHNNNAVTVVVSWQGREDIADSAKKVGAVDLAASCGQAGSKRRQVVIESFFY